MSQDKSVPTTPQDGIPNEPQEATQADPTPGAGPEPQPKDEAPLKFADAREMGFFEHLEELRARLIKCLWVFMVGFGLAYWVSDDILLILKKPLYDVLSPEQQHLYFTSLFENFMTHLKIAGVASLFVFSPYFFYQLWAFVAPGLYPRERKLVIPFISGATVFFVGGASFAYFILFPVGFKFFVDYGTKDVLPMLTIDNYFTTCLKLLVLFGIAFELPVLITLFGYLGLVDAPMLRRQRRVAIVVMAVISALFAPPDAISMLILLAPLILMYEGAIVVVHWIGLKRAARFASEDAAAAGQNGSGAAPSEPPSNPFDGKSRP